MTTKTSSAVLQRCDQFVGRTTNWLYDHLRFLPHHTPIVLFDTLINRDEFPLLQARHFNHRNFIRRVWHRVFGKSLSPSDWRWLQRFCPVAFHSHFGYVAIDDLALQQTLGL